MDLGDSLIKSNGPVSIAVDASRLRHKTEEIEPRHRGQERLRAEERGSQARKQAVIEQRKFEPRAWSGIFGQTYVAGAVRRLLAELEPVGDH